MNFPQCIIDIIDSYCQLTFIKKTIKMQLSNDIIKAFADHYCPNVIVMVKNDNIIIGYFIKNVCKLKVFNLSGEFVDEDYTVIDTMFNNIIFNYNGNYDIISFEHNYCQYCYDHAVDFYNSNNFFTTFIFWSNQIYIHYRNTISFYDKVIVGKQIDFKTAIYDGIIYVLCYEFKLLEKYKLNGELIHVKNININQNMCLHFVINSKSPIIYNCFNMTYYELYENDYYELYRLNSEDFIFSFNFDCKYKLNNDNNLILQLNSSLDS